MKKALSLSIAILTLFASNLSYARETALVCLFDNPKAPLGFDSRLVIVGQSTKPVAVKMSSAPNAQTLMTKSYAMVGTRVSGKYVFYTLKGNEFTVSSLGQGVYQFQDLKNRKVGECELNGRKNAQPSFTGSN